MTTELHDKLNRIKAACRRALELSEKATPGPWIKTQGIVVKGEGQHGRMKLLECESFDETPDADNAEFIAHARTFAPAAAQATLTAIEGLEKNASPALGGKLQQYAAQQALESLASQWPEDALA